MNLDWSSFLTWHNIVSLLDILVVWFVFYELIMLLRGTKAVQLLRGIIMIVLIKIVSVYAGLVTVSWLMDQVINWGVIAMIIIFQPRFVGGWNTLAVALFLFGIGRSMKPKPR